MRSSACSAARPFARLSALTALPVVVSLATLSVLSGCTGRDDATPPSARSASAATDASRSSSAWRIVLAPQDGDGEIDRRIARRQRQAAEAEDPVPHLERLGHLFVAKARASGDPGYYTLAERCATCIEERAPGQPSAMLLRGHVAQSLHRFDDAERIARALVARRGEFLDQGLLGDVLLDKGQLAEALTCYQKMLDLKPCLQSYTRAARVRFLRGDLDGSRKLLRMATRSGSRRDPEPLCWTLAELARLELQAGDTTAARRAVDEALGLLDGYAPALLVAARIDLAADDAERAVARLREATATRPEPEYLWAFADALRVAGKGDEAARVEADLERDGARDDPRAFALWLATSARLPERALALALTELKVRHDVHTHDAHAWTLLHSGQARAAAAAIERALAEGTEDARILYHAGAIAAANAQTARARRLLDRAHDLRRMLWPSEQEDLSRRRALL